MWHFVLTHGGYLTRGSSVREFESRREQGKTRLQFSRRIYSTPKYLFYNKNRWQSDKIKEYGNARVMSSNPIAYHISESDVVNNSVPWGREFESRREKGKPCLQIARRICYTQKYPFLNKNRLQSDEIPKSSKVNKK